MEDTLISFETAKLAKEKGFDWKTLKRYQDNETNPVGNSWYNHNSAEEQKLWNTGLYSAPTQSLLQKWLRENYQIDITIEVLSSKEESKEPFTKYSNYEEALEQGLIEALKSITLIK